MKAYQFRKGSQRRESSLTWLERRGTVRKQAGRVRLIVRTCLFDMFGCSIQNLSTSNFCKSVSALIMQIIQAIMNQWECVKFPQTFQAFSVLFVHFSPVDFIHFSLCSVCSLTYFFHMGIKLSGFRFSQLTPLSYNTKYSWHHH